MELLPAFTTVVLAVALAFMNAASVQAGKVLVFPVDGSHWLNMNLLVEGLHTRGHEVTVVRTSTSWYIKEQSPHYNSITIPMSKAMNMESQDFFVDLLGRMLVLQREKDSMISWVSFYREMLTLLYSLHHQACQVAVKIFENKALMQSLRDAQYDVVLMDPGLPIGVLVAHELKLPTVFNVRWITSGEGHFLVAPSPASYVPVCGCAVTDNMAFMQRVKNMLFFLWNTAVDTLVVCPHYNRLVDKYLEPGTNFYQLLQGAHIWLMRVDFVFEFPRPTMPNIVYIGGFQCKPSKPLPADLEDFVQSSGEHGVILMSLGSLVKGLPIEITNCIASAFAQLPQKVIWRHAGETPSTLGNNTMLVKWIPQNDLLGHPKVRAFVSHGGTNGIYEAIYHGVPIVGVPLLFDQFDNILRMEVRGAAKVVDVTKLTSQNFVQVLQEVLHNTSYRDNMKRMSDLHRDRPMHPLDTALFWTEFVMRNKGAAHLRTESYKLPWYSYHSLDVVCLLLAVLSLLATGTVMLIYCLCFKLCRRKDKQE
ncbi:hypothetical protein NHX12_018340 [Muraenolepis orangiensis]|uniref:UDP-glucuronosyltransferase n=1 Tax=Muraenolepis orangiensis TaxID=630683 RepID=A0A9Q0IXX6_9TELE|nr:hypothetical protein NHX12_018340 [Muraenolepis orangiensis]